MAGRGASKTNAWKDRNKSQTSQPKRQEGSRGGAGSQVVQLSQAEEKFLAAKSRMQASVQKHLHDDYHSSSEEDELETENILSSMIKKYSSLANDVDVDLGRTQKFLEDAFQSGAAVCLICIATVKRPDAIWSCTKCFCFFHVICIQRWAKDSVTHQKQVLEERQQAPPNWDKLTWACPKCRNNYSSSEIPHKYFCFCGREEDPEFHPWLVPHSCGETCNKPLQPSCGHFCLLLCHPGPCPPCPKTVQSRCHCGRAAPRAQRCSSKAWSCGAACGRQLACGKHTCDAVCHSGACEPCPRQSTQLCLCQRNSAIRECAEPVWQCDQVCGKPLSCGNHRCETVCHVAGACGQCALTQTRHCPCGKSQHLLPCDKETPTCGDTCGKTLECGQHACHLRCHSGPCGPCLERVVKTCRCGLHSNEVPCTKEYICESKCKRKRDCNLHACNRKCCDGACPPCEKPCGKPLKCGKHRCQSICHHGPCYPCALTEELHCWCKATTQTRPCSTNKKRFSCNKLCRIPPYCHHEKRKPHKCHSGLCPPCKQVCGTTYEACGHTCKDVCHLPYLKEPNIPQKQREKIVQDVRRPCNPCSEPVTVPCLGGHEMMSKPCHKAFHTSCGRKCGRRLACGNHTCDKECHTVLGADDETVAGATCLPCNLGCQLARAAGCTHACPHACHPPPCRPCTVMLRLSCHCQLVQLYVRCGDYVAATAERRVSMLTCDNQCPKNYPCGHRCASTCHAGECPDPESCRQNVKVSCKCKRIRKTFRCVAVRAGEAVVQCDEVCLAKKEEEAKKKELEKQKQMELEEKKNREELEKFQKKFQGRKKHKERRSYEVDDKKSFISQYWPWLLASGGLTVAILAFYWL